MTEWVIIKNHGQVCEVIDRNAAGGILLRNPNHGKTLIFHPGAVEPIPQGQFIHCWNCQCPILLTCDPASLHINYCCSPGCYQDKQRHYN